MSQKLDSSLAEVDEGLSGAEEEEEEVEEEGDEGDDEDDGEGLDLLWKAVVKPDEPCVVAPVENYFLRITNACLGPDAKESTRTCLTIVQGEDEESDAPGVVCTLRNDYENHQLNLLVTDDVQLSVSGENPSPIYLVGYLSPAQQHVVDDMDLDDELENLDDESAEEFEEANSKQLFAHRKRKLAEIENEGEDEETVTSAQKKQKTASGQAKPQNQQQKGKKEENKNKQNPTPTPNPNQNKNQNKNPNQNKNQNPNQNKNPNPNQNKNQNPNQNKNQNKNQNPNQNPNQNKNQNPNQNKNQNKNQKNKKANESTEAATPKAEESATKTPETPTAVESGAKDENNKEDVKGWKSGPQGVKYKDVRAGDTGEAIKKGSSVRLFYVAQLGDKKVVDKVIGGEGKEIKVGSNEVIQGLDHALLGMKAGAKRRITIPAKLAYGEAGDAAKNIPPNSDLTYTVEVKQIN